MAELTEKEIALRDWFAGQALAGYFANRYTAHKNSANGDMSEYCYQAATEMMRERERILLCDQPIPEPAVHTCEKCGVEGWKMCEREDCDNVPF